MRVEREIGAAGLQGGEHGGDQIGRARHREPDHAAAAGRRVDASRQPVGARVQLAVAEQERAREQRDRAGMGGCVGSESAVDRARRRAQRQVIPNRNRDPGLASMSDDFGNSILYGSRKTGKGAKSRRPRQATAIRDPWLRVDLLCVRFR